MSDQKQMAVPHLITMENRDKITLTGVCEVGNFDEESITLKTSMGVLCIRGAGLHISTFDVATGELSADGKIAALHYTGESKNGGFFSRIFK